MFSSLVFHRSHHLNWPRENACLVRFSKNIITLVTIYTTLYSILLYWTACDSTNALSSIIPCGRGSILHGVLSISNFPLRLFFHWHWHDIPMQEWHCISWMDLSTKPSTFQKVHPYFPLMLPVTHYHHWNNQKMFNHANCYYIFCIAYFGKHFLCRRFFPHKQHKMIYVATDMLERKKNQTFCKI